MKKLALTIVSAMAISGVAFAQGYIQWVTPTTGVTFQTNTAASPLFGGSGTGGTVGNTANVAGGFDYALLTEADPLGILPTDTSVWDGTWTGNVNFTGGGLTATNGTGPSGFGKANATPGADTAQEVSWANGTTNGIVIVGWSANLGSSWTTVSNILAALALGNTAPLLAQDPNAFTTSMAFFGETAFGDLNPNGSSPGIAITQIAPGQGAPGLAIYSLNTQLYALAPIPEPATMALAGLGGLSLLLFRRKRS